MEQQKIILKWVLASVKITYKMLATSAEVFSRRCFGRRYAPKLLLSFCFCMVALALLQSGHPQESGAIVGYYIAIHFILVMYHICGMWRRRTPVQSYSTGQSWEIWQRLNINPTIAKSVIDPLLNVIAGLLLYHESHLLSVWLQLGGLCLFIKEFLFNWEFGNRVLDSLDARMEGERIGTAVRQQTNPQAGGEQAVIPVAEVNTAQIPANQAHQFYAGLDPALQRLMARPNQNPPRVVFRPHNPTAATRNQNRPLRKNLRRNGAPRPRPPWES